MTLNYDELIAQVRTILGLPNQHFPSDDLLLQKLSDVSQEMRNRASLLGAGVSQRSELIYPAPGQETITLAAPEAGRIIRVHLSDVPSGAREFTKIPVISREDVGHYSENYTDEYPAACVAWLEYGQRKIEFIPAPMRLYYGKVWYETGAVRVTKRDVADILPEYYSLLRDKTALYALPLCDWEYLRSAEKTIPLLDREGLYDKRKAKLQGDIKATLMMSIATSEQRYDQYAASLSVGGYESNEMFAQSYIDSEF